MVIDQDIITWVNQAFTNLTLFGFKEVIGQRISQVVATNLNPALKVEIRQALKEHNSWQGIVETKRKDGKTFPALVLISAVADTRSTNKYCVIFADVSEQILLNKEKEKYKEQTIALQRLGSLSAMSAGLVHEIAQPLNSIKVLVDGILYRRNNHYPLTNEEIFGNLNDISFELGRIEEIIRHMRSFANLNEEPCIEPCSWNDIIYNSLRILGRQLAAHGIEIKLELNQELPMMWGNSNRLDEVIINLLVNSMQALGYKQVIAYLDGLIDREGMIEEIKRETRRFAKRQLTWFKKDKRIHWFEVGHSCQKEIIIEKIVSYIEGQFYRV
jgi:PAS domain S-box-containing protein